MARIDGWAWGEKAEFDFGRLLVQHCTDDQLAELERRINADGTRAAVRWIAEQGPAQVSAMARDLLRTDSARYPKSGGGIDA